MRYSWKCEGSVGGPNGRAAERPSGLRAEAEGRRSEGLAGKDVSDRRSGYGEIMESASGRASSRSGIERATRIYVTVGEIPLHSMIKIPE